MQTFRISKLCFYFSALKACLALCLQPQKEPLVLCLLHSSEYASNSDIKEAKLNPRVWLPKVFMLKDDSLCSVKTEKKWILRIVLSIIYLPDVPNNQFHVLPKKQNSFSLAARLLLACHCISIIGLAAFHLWVFQRPNRLMAELLTRAPFGPSSQSRPL